MNIEDGLEDQMKAISAANGICLSLEERIKILTTLDQLKSDIKCDEMQFWGKILGAEKDYYICKAFYYKGYKNFPKKKYFFCSSNNFIFSELPDIQPHHFDNFYKFNSYFIGNPLKKTEKKQEEILGTTGAGKKKEKKKKEKKNQKEEINVDFEVGGGNDYRGGEKRRGGRGKGRGGYFHFKAEDFPEFK